MTYEVLSYAWCESSVTASPLCNDRPADVTIDLEFPLRHLEHVGRLHPIRADALCITVPLGSQILIVRGYLSIDRRSVALFVS